MKRRAVLGSSRNSWRSGLIAIALRLTFSNFAASAFVRNRVMILNMRLLLQTDKNYAVHGQEHAITTEAEML